MAAFWESKPLEAMSQDEWESLCDHCGLCCLVRLEDEDDGEIYETNVICRHYDCRSARCMSYNERDEISHGCVKLTPQLVREFDWLPDSCAYRTIYRGDPLPATHPLLYNPALNGEAEPVTGGVFDVRQRFEHIGLVKDGPDIIHEHYLIATDSLFESGSD